MPQQEQPIPEKRYYFDAKYLKKYIDQKMNPKVFVNGRFVTISDLSDLESEVTGVGYDEYGNPKLFQYRDIEKIKVGKETIDIDQLQTLAQQGPAEPASGEEETPEDQEAPEGGEGPTGGGGGPIGGGDTGQPEDLEAEPGPEGGEEEVPEEPELAHYNPYQLGKELIREGRTRKEAKKEINKIVRILEHPYYNVTGVITDVYKDEFEVRCMSRLVGRILVNKKNVKFV